MEIQDFESEIAGLRAVFLQAAQDRRVAVGTLIETCIRIAVGAAVVMGVENMLEQHVKDVLKAVTAARDAGALTPSTDRKH
jgi:hypothetical protein